MSDPNCSCTHAEDEHLYLATSNRCVRCTCDGYEPAAVPAPDRTAEERVRALIRVEEAWTREFDSYELKVSIPNKAGQAEIDRIFDAVADLVYEMTKDRRDWDPFIAGQKNPCNVPVHLIKRALEGES